MFKYFNNNLCKYNIEQKKCHIENIFKLIIIKKLTKGHSLIRKK